VAEVDRVLAELRQQGPTAAEVELAQTEIEVGFFESIGSLQGKADLLNSYNMKTGNPGYLAQDRARYGLVTAATAQKAAQDYLPADRRVVMHITPGAKP
jgi:zinc protease